MASAPDDLDLGGGLDFDSLAATAPPEPNTTTAPVIVVSAKLGSLPTSSEDVARLCDVLARSGGRLQCVRFEASGERALAYFKDEAGAQKASEALALESPHLQSRKATATIHAVMAQVSYAAVLLEEYLRAIFEGFGEVLGVDLITEHEAVLVHMADSAAAESAHRALNGRADGAWMWRLSLNKACARSGSLLIWLWSGTHSLLFRLFHAVLTLSHWTTSPPTR